MTPRDERRLRQFSTLSVDVIEDLVADLNDVRLVAQLMRSFLAELPRRVEEIISATNSTDCRVATEAATLLRSTCASLGMIRLGTVAEIIERNSHLGLIVSPEIEREMTNAALRTEAEVLQLLDLMAHD